MAFLCTPALYLGWNGQRRDRGREGEEEGGGRGERGKGRGRGGRERGREREGEEGEEGEGRGAREVTDYSTVYLQREWLGVEIKRSRIAGTVLIYTIISDFIASSPGLPRLEANSHPDKGSLGTRLPRLCVCNHSSVVTSWFPALTPVERELINKATHLVGKLSLEIEFYTTQK